MGELISRSAVMNELEKFKLPEDCMEHEWALQAADDVAKYTIKTIKAAPTIDAVPVVHGEFEKQPEEVILNLRVTPLLCKTCRTTFITLNKEGKRCMCCSYCGAKMDEKEND